MGMTVITTHILTETTTIMLTDVSTQDTIVIGQNTDMFIMVTSDITGMTGISMPAMHIRVLVLPLFITLVPTDLHTTANPVSW